MIEGVGVVIVVGVRSVCFDFSFVLFGHLRVCVRCDRRAARYREQIRSDHRRDPAGGVFASRTYKQSPKATLDLWCHRKLDVKTAR